MFVDHEINCMPLKDPAKDTAHIGMSAGVQNGVWKYNKEFVKDRLGTVLRDVLAASPEGLE